MKINMYVNRWKRKIMKCNIKIAIYSSCNWVKFFNSVDKDSSLLSSRSLHLKSVCWIVYMAYGMYAHEKRKRKISKPLISYSDWCSQRNIKSAINVNTRFLWRLVSSFTHRTFNFVRFRNIPADISRIWFRLRNLLRMHNAINFHYKSFMDGN